MKERLESLIQLYLNEQNRINFPIASVIRLIEMVKETYDKDGRVFIFGNGGGASIADHFASDLAIHPFVSEDKHSFINKPRLRVLCLNESSGLITRLGNDIGFDRIFSEQLRVHKVGVDDLVITFSTSGNSVNIIKAIKYANMQDAKTILIGGHKGGIASNLVSVCILIPGESKFPGQVGANDNCFHIEDFQTVISHMVTGLIKELINGKTLEYSYTTS